MSTTLVLHHISHHADDGGVTTAIVAPSWGGGVIALAHQDQRWQWPSPILEVADPASIALKPTSYGMPLLGPTPGRVGANQSGEFQFGGERHCIAPPRHGFLRDLAWTVEHSEPGGLTCRLEVEPSEARGSFPFQFTARHEILLGAARLTSRVSVINTGDHAQPIDFGWHPYLHRGEACRIRIPASHLWELDGAAEPVPTGRLLPASGTSDFRFGRELAAGEHWDDVFTVLDADADGFTTAVVEAKESILLRDGATQAKTVRRIVAVRASGGDGAARPIRHMQLYTPPGRRAICLEPLSSPPDVLNLSDCREAGVSPTLVQPGQTVRFEMTLALAVADD